MKNCLSNLALSLVLAAPLALADQPVSTEPDGAALYQQHCASCHEGGVAKAPQLSLLQIMPPTSILRAMQGGVMQTQAAAMTDAQQR